MATAVPAAEQQAPQQFYPEPPPAAIYAGPDIFLPASGQPASKTLAVLAILLIIILAVVVSVARRRTRGPRGAPHLVMGGARGSALGDGLGAKGWTLYTLDTCGYCAEQMKVLGAVGRLRHVRCGGHGSPACRDLPGMFPFWKNSRTGETRAGLQTRGQLEEML